MSLTVQERNWIRRLKRCLAGIPETLWLQREETEPDLIHIGKGTPTHTSGTTFSPSGACSSSHFDDDDMHIDSVQLPGYRTVNHRSQRL